MFKRRLAQFIIIATILGFYSVSFFYWKEGFYTFLALGIIFAFIWAIVELTS